MELHIYFDTADLDDTEIESISGTLSTLISDWASTHKGAWLLPNESTKEGLAQNLESKPIGLGLQLKSKFKLKEPLNFLYTIAKEHKCEFVIAMLDEETGVAEDVCYFGHEEGRPDLHEVANYLGL